MFPQLDIGTKLSCTTERNIRIELCIRLSVPNSHIKVEMDVVITFLLAQLGARIDVIREVGSSTMSALRKTKEIDKILGVKQGLKNYIMRTILVS